MKNTLTFRGLPFLRLLESGIVPQFKVFVELWQMRHSLRGVDDQPMSVRGVIVFANNLGKMVVFFLLVSAGVLLSHASERNRVAISLSCSGAATLCCISYFGFKKHLRFIGKIQRLDELLKIRPETSNGICDLSPIGIVMQDTFCQIVREQAVSVLRLEVEEDPKKVVQFAKIYEGLIQRNPLQDESPDERSLELVRQYVREFRGTVSELNFNIPKIKEVYKTARLTLEQSAHQRKEEGNKA
ncbi:MAG: hypothetical protein Q7R64_01220 [bacterium]|nr:hypothetical protein [bacterium]